MWYKLAQVKQKTEEFYNLLKTNPDFSSTKAQFLKLLNEVGAFHVDREALQNAYKQISDEYLTRYREQKGTNPSQQSNNNTSPIPPTSQSTPQTNTTVKDLTLDKADELERLRPEDKSGDLIVRPTGGELDLYKPKKDDDDPKNPEKDDGGIEKCIIEEEVFIQNLLTGLTGYAQIYFKKKIFTISQDTYGGNRSPLAPLQRLVGLTPPDRLDPNTQAYDPASSSWRAPSTRDFARPAGPLRDKNGRILKDPSGANMTVSAPVKDKTVVWNTADVQSIMSSLEKIAQMPELQKYGAKEITNILRYPLLQVKRSGSPLKHQILDKEVQIRRYNSLLLTPPPGYTEEDIKKIIQGIEDDIASLESTMKDDKPDVEVVPFKEFYKLTELSRYYIYKGSQLNSVFCKLETQLIKTLNNTLNTLGRVEKNKRLKEIYENARGKK